MPSETSFSKALATQGYFRREPADFKDYKDLPVWVRTACAFVFLNGMTQKEAARRCGKAAGTLGGYINHSPAVQDWIQKLKSASTDPVKMAEWAIQGNALGVSMEYYAAYEKAIDANDYKEVARMSQDFLDRAGVTRKKDTKDDGKITVTLNIAGGLDVPTVTASYDEVETVDTDFEIETKGS